jgi:hypothetical protein
VKRAAIFASAALGVGVGCAFDLPEPKAGGSEIIQPEAGSEGGASSGAATPDGGDPASPCLTQGGWLFCDDFDAKSGLSALWTLGVDLDGDQTSLDKASGRLTAKLPKADPGDKKKARVGTTVDLDEKGLAHEGLLPDLMEELARLGADPGPLRSSAEAYLRMWERASGPRAGMADPAEDLDAGGVAPFVEHKAREDKFPKRCNLAYCPAYQVVGGECRFDAECESGRCSAVLCGAAPGKCQAS